MYELIIIIPANRQPQYKEVMGGATRGTEEEAAPLTGRQLYIHSKSVLQQVGNIHYLLWIVGQRLSVMDYRSTFIVYELWFMNYRL